MAVVAAGTAAPAVAAELKAVAPLARYAVTTAAVPMSVIGARITDSTYPTHVAYTEAQSESGGRSSALASPVWTDFPGQRVADRLHVPGAASLVAVRASYPGGPDRSASNVPGGPSATATATSEAAFAAASASTASVQGLAIADEMAGQSQAAGDGDNVVGRGTATVGKVHVLGGLITIEGVLTRVRIVSDGVRAVVDGDTTVHRVVVAGVPASLTATGLRGLPEPVEQLLAQLGVTVRLVEPADSLAGGSGSRSVGGVLVRFDSAAARQLFDGRRAPAWAAEATPEPLAAWLGAMQEHRGDVTLRFGQVAVSAVADAPAATMIAETTRQSGSALAVLSGQDVAAGEPAAVAADVLPVDEVAAGSVRRFVEIAGGAGIPASLIALAIVTALAFAVPLARVVEEAAEIPPQ